MVVLGLVGLPGTGKGTVADLLVKHHGFECIVIQKQDESINKSIEHLCLTSHSFTDLEAAADFALSNWRTNYVILGIDCDEQALELFKKRTLFVLMIVTAPISSIISRFNMSPETIQRIDQFNTNPWFLKFQEAAKIILGNNGSVDDLRVCLDGLKPGDSQWIRPDWDTYFMQLGHLASQRSNCMKRRVGAVIVHDKKVVATGYNGTPRGLTNCLEGGCPRCNHNTKCGQSLDSCLCMHAEENALLEVGQVRCNNATLYSTSTPCLGCTKKIIQVGIKRVVYDIEYSLDHNSKDLFLAAGVKLEKHRPSLPKFYSCKQ